MRLAFALGEPWLLPDDLALAALHSGCYALWPRGSHSRFSCPRSAPPHSDIAPRLESQPSGKRVRDCYSPEPARRNLSAHGTTAMKGGRAVAPASTCPTPYRHLTEYGARRPGAAGRDSAGPRRALAVPN